MRKLYVLFASFMIVGLSPAYAGVDLSWAATWGFSPPGGDGQTMGILNPAINPAQSVSVQLIWTPSNTISPALGGTGARPDFTSGDNQVVRSIVVSTATGSTEFGDFSAPNWQVPGDEDDNVWLPGFAFARVFDAPSSALDVGSWYYDSPSIQLADLAAGTGFPQSLELNQDSLGPELGDALNQQIALIPEPNTMVLLGVGAFAAALRRRTLG